MKTYREKLRKMLARSVALNGLKFDPAAPENANDLLGGLKRFLHTAICSADPEDPATKDAIQLVKQAYGGDSEKMASLNALRIEQVSNFILGSIDLARGFFEVQTLQPNERPAVQIETKQQINVNYIAQDGDVRRVKILPTQSETLVDLYTVASDEVTYRLRDIYSGDIEQNALKTVDIAFDVAMKVDQLAFTLLGTAFGAFTTTGAKTARTFLAHSSINADNIPTTNDLVLSGNTSSTKFRWEGLSAIRKYCDTWGDAWPDGPLVPTGDIFIPSVDTTDILASVSPTGSTSNPVADAAMANYTTVSFAGTDWRFIPCNRLPSGVCYPRLNKPVGKLYFKPSMDLSYDNGASAEAIRKSEGTRFQSKVVGMYIAEPHKVRAVRVTYHS